MSELRWFEDVFGPLLCQMHDELVLVGGVLIYALMLVKGFEWGKRDMQRVC
jgi:hypothetical protein